MGRRALPPSPARRPRLLLLVCLLAVASAARAATDPRPNILFIVADDLGINDLASFRITDPAVEGAGAGKSTTPTIDRLAREGLRFSRFYSDASCAATRAGMLTGLAPASLGFRPSAAGIDPAVLTLPERLREAGYTTHLVGKWHLGFDDREAWPLQQGFDTFFGFLNQFFLQRPAGVPQPGRPGYRDPYLQTDNGERRRYPGHLSRALLESARSRIHAGAAQSAPWFLAFWPYAPHEPLQPPPDLAGDFGASPQGRHRALLATLDRQVAGLVSALEESGQRGRTLIVFASDNGGTGRYAPSNAPLAGAKGFFYEGGVRVPLWIHGPQTRQGRWDHRPASYLDLAPTLLSTAEVAPPRELVGVDLRDPRRPPRRYFWSAAVAEAQAWSVLSADGRRRLIRDALRPIPVLYAVAARGAARPVDEGDAMARLRRAHEAWAPTTRRVKLTLEPAGAGVLRVTGPRFQMAPGSGAHALALCTVMPPAGVSGRLASQDDLWSLEIAGDELRWEVNGLSLTAPLPRGPRGRLLLASDFNPSLAFPGRSATLQLFWNDRLIASARAADFPLRRKLGAPLLIGSGEVPVKLGDVAIWNDIPPQTALTSGDAWARWSGGFDCAGER